MDSFQFSIIFIPLEVPIRFAPAASISAAFSALRIPPDAFTPKSLPTVFLISSMWRAVAPFGSGFPLESFGVANPVDVFTKSAPA